MLRLLMALSDFEPFKGYFAGQFRKPRGWLGRQVAKAMNKANLGLSRQTLDALKLKKGAQVLEIGFGGGVGLQELLDRGHRPSGADFSKDMFEDARARFPSLDLRLAALPRLPFKTAAFDAVLGVNTLYFWEEPLACAEELKRVLKKGAKLGLGVRDKALIQQNGYDRHGFRPYGEEELEALLRKAGFKAVHITTTQGRGIKSLSAVGTKG